MSILAVFPIFLIAQYASAQSSDCYTRFLFAWHTVNPVLDCMEERLDAGGDGEANTASNLNPNTGIFASKVGVDLQFKSLINGTGIGLSSNSTNITITNTSSGGESTVCNNVGTGNQLCSGGNVNLDTLIAGTGITITDTTDDWTFASQCNNTGTGQAVCESGNNINSLIAGTGITITDTNGDLTIASTPPEDGGQLIAVVYQSVTKTNIGTSFVDVYTSAFDMENLVRVDCSLFTEFRVLALWDYVGSGIQTVQWVDVNNNSNVFLQASTFSSDQDPYSTGYFTKDSWCTGNTFLEMQAKSSVAGDDPTARGYVIYAKK